MVGLKNRQVFYRDPTDINIPNNGVAKVAEPESENDFKVLRYELESFVCHGEYRAGMERILSSFLANTVQPQQQAAWVSGFYGSGKSHLVRVLEYLWRDMEFPDGTKARSLVDLPPDIRAHLVELSRMGRQEGGLWSAAGALTGTQSVKLALLSIVLKSARLPEEYPAARLVLWLKQNSWYDQVNDAMESRGRVLRNELRDMYVSPWLAQSLSEVIEEFPRETDKVHDLLRTQFQPVPDISDDELHRCMRDVLSLKSTSDGKLPLTLLVFDELQQFIANDPERTLHVQEVVEDCSRRFGSHLLFVGTGQSAMEAHNELAKLQGRFAIRVTLSDVDVEKVVREVVLRKSPDQVESVRNVLDTHSGEIDRHLADTKIGRQPADTQDRVYDYPLLPVRRRLWERLLRAVDTAGTAGQLRTQLKIVHEATRDIAEMPLGTVIPSDAIYRQIKDHMLTNGTLPRDVSTRIDQLDDGTEEGRLRSRLCSIIFMLGKLPQSGALETGVKATANTLADLMVEDITTGSGPLRQQVPTVLQDLVDNGRLIVIDDEYRLQTPESEEWESDYRARLSQIRANEVKISEIRNQALQSAFDASLKDIRFPHGVVNTLRKYTQHFETDSPSGDGENVPVWIQGEWSTPLRSIVEESQQAGTDSPTVFVFLPRLETDELRETIARMESARETLSTKQTSATGSSMEAKEAMESRHRTEQLRLNHMADAIVQNARIYQGGGNEVNSGSFFQSFKHAVESSIDRLFPEFHYADHKSWDTVITRASEGGPDPLHILGHTGEVDKHAVCKEIWSYVSNEGKKGSEVRRHFARSPYGWPQDAVDGALLALLRGEFLKATRSGIATKAGGMTRQQIASTDFAREGVTVSVNHRMAVRRIATAVDSPMKNGEEAEALGSILARITEQSNSAGGEAPLPQTPDNSLVIRLQGLTGNQQMVEAADNAEKLIEQYRAWSEADRVIRERMPAWDQLTKFLRHAWQLDEYEDLARQAEAVRSGRTLLYEVNPVPPLLNQVTGILRQTVSEKHSRLRSELERQKGELEAMDGWSKVKQDRRDEILKSRRLNPVSDLGVGSNEELLASLDDTSIEEWDNHILAIPTRGAQAREQVAQLLSPEAVTIQIPRAILESREEVESYVQDLREQLLEQVQQSPVRIA